MRPKTFAICLLLCVGFFSLFITISYGQLTKVWENHYAGRYDSNFVFITDGSTSFYGNKLQFDGSGNCYFLSEIIPPNIDSPAGTRHPQMQVIKYNSLGSTVWIHKDTGSHYSYCNHCGLYPYPYEMIVHNDGTFYSSASDNAQWLGYSSQFLASTKSTGISNWATSTLINQYYPDMVEDYLGNLGFISNPGGPTSLITISKVTSLGNLLWSKDHSSPDGYSQYGYPKITTDKTGNFYTISGTGNFNDTAISNVWLTKFDTSGIFLWEKKIDSGNSIINLPEIMYNIIDSCIYGTYAIITNGNVDKVAKLIKLNTSGIVQWRKSVNTISGFTRLKQDKQGNTYFWSGDQDYGQLPYPDKTNEEDIIKYNSAGTELGHMYGNSFDMDASGNTYTTNYFFDNKTYKISDRIRKYSPTGILLYEAPTIVTGDNYTSEVYLYNSTNLYSLKEYAYDTVSVTKYNAACSAKAAPAKPKSITGSAVMYCDNSYYNYSCPAVANALYYNWTVPIGVIIDSGQGTTKLYVHHYTGFKTGQISVYASNCIGASAAVVKAVTDTLKPVAKITGSTSVCKGQKNVLYSIPAVAGATYYHWSIPADAAFSIGYGGSGDEGTSVGIDFGNTSGKVSVYAVNYCDSSVAKSIQVKVTNCVAGVSVEAQSNKSIIYPNPSLGAFTLKFGNVGKGYHQPLTVVVKDVSGKVMEQWSSVTASSVSFGGRLVKGVYFVEVVSGGEKEVLKVVKE